MPSLSAPPPLLRPSAAPAPPRAAFLSPRASPTSSPSAAAAAAAASFTTSDARPRAPPYPSSPPPHPQPHRVLRRHGMQPACTSLYEVLGIPVGATCQEIKVAYRRLARSCHPDAAAMDRKGASADEFMRIHAAYSTLSDPEKRAVYDSSLFWRRSRPLTVVSGGGGGGESYRGRNWETDQCW
ncbi:chaperone protein dnaJ 11, chloroplastic-like [Syzygium oleosum]|uniref:chaperone protein dnaJ 11, chloroplastic-like n=1 Tax=Syzygium oleosum TaxID=219896 RepID=UPI0024B9C485|nr:chaperone protein dnaJ 11, chloroplastic-like [Syzygium oleosum]